jgi:hypothetical protein
MSNPEPAIVYARVCALPLPSRAFERKAARRGEGEGGAGKEGRTRGNLAPEGEKERALRPCSRHERIERPDPRRERGFLARTLARLPGDALAGDVVLPTYPAVSTRGGRGEGNSAIRIGASLAAGCARWRLKLEIPRRRDSPGLLVGGLSPIGIWRREGGDSGAPGDLAYPFWMCGTAVPYKLKSINLAFPDFLQITITSGSYNLCATPAVARSRVRGYPCRPKRHVDGTLVNIDTLARTLRAGASYGIGVKLLTDGRREAN